jgi:hypothetical protein
MFLTKDYLDINLLIQCIQRAEGNPDCFRRVRHGCSEVECCWRPYCLEEPQEFRGSDQDPLKGQDGPGTAGLPGGTG